MQSSAACLLNQFPKSVWRFGDDKMQQIYSCKGDLSFRLQGAMSSQRQQRQGVDFHAKKYYSNLGRSSPRRFFKSRLTSLSPTL